MVMMILKKKQEKEVQVTLENKDETIDYEEKMEKKLSETLSMVEGVGRVKVMVTLENSSESVVEKDIPNKIKEILSTYVPF